jgi:5-methyltetrahydrofolate--homocysteine methyltransferase
MSGLLVKSTVVMRENLEEMSREGVTLPTLLGGAALTRQYVETDCRAAYACGRVAYARDAFDGLHLMAKVVDGEFDSHVAAQAEKRAARPANARRILGRAKAAAAVDPDWARERRIALADGLVVPTPPFWGPRIIARVPVKALVPFLNERMLYQFQWGFRKDGRSLDDYLAWARRELRPTLRRLIEVAIQQDILQPQASYGYWKAAAEGDTLILYAEDGATEAARFDLPRQAAGDRRCITDFIRDASFGPESRDVVALQVVTMGQRASDVAREWFGDDRYQDYLYLHGLGVEMAEALAEYVHKRIRAELGLAQDDARDKDALLRQGYRGSRYSFGYPACPRLEDQTQILALLDAAKYFSV